MPRPPITVKVSYGNDKTTPHLLRQSEQQSGTWKDHKFLINQNVEECDWWVVCHASSLTKPETTRCDPDHIIFISMEPSEPPEHSEFYNQFSQLVLVDEVIKHKSIKRFSATTWWVGIKVEFNGSHQFSPEVTETYESLSNTPPGKKINRISLICSAKDFLPGHKIRTDFINKLKESPASQHIDFFGAGSKPIPDKLDAIAPYKYHLAIENTIANDYWTEKLSDSFLGYAMPIYAGCPNISQYFPGNSLFSLDLTNTAAAISTINDVIRLDPYDSRLTSVVQARSKVLNDYNLLNIISQLCERKSANIQTCTLRPRGDLNIQRLPLTKLKQFARRIIRLL